MSAIALPHNSKISPPIRNISVNKNHVVFDDTMGRKNIRLENTIQAKKFVNWLLSESYF